MARKVVYTIGNTKKICQLTGEVDRELNKPTVNQTESRFGLVGTDLGASFEHRGRIYFLFGDTNSTPASAEATTYRRSTESDSIAWTESTDPEQGLYLYFVTAPDGAYLSPRVPIPGSDTPFTRKLEVPTGGLSANGQIYVFFTTCPLSDPLYPERDLMGGSILARLDDDVNYQFTRLYDLSRLDTTWLNTSPRSSDSRLYYGGKFINISPVIVNNAEISGLPETTGQGLLLWGSGLFRQSDSYLAYLPLNAVENQEALRYFAGMEAGSQQPVWSTQPANAVALFHHPVIGELSVSWNPPLQKWLMLYNADEPHGINFRTADHPWGPWSPTALLFDPWADRGFCHFIHVNWDYRVCDSVHDPGRERGGGSWGNAYGPYVISKFTRAEEAGATIYFVMSTWNPYNTCS